MNGRLGIGLVVVMLMSLGLVGLNGHRTMQAAALLQTATPTPRPADVAPPAPGKVCWRNPAQADNTIAGPAVPPEPFLHRPFAAQFYLEDWSSQFDHQYPNYGRDGVLAALGETLLYDAPAESREGFEPRIGGAEAICGKARRRFKAGTTVAQMEALGCYLLAYESPVWEMFAYYDGHDGHDYAVTGAALAAAPGEVVFAGDHGDKLGNVVEIVHPNGYLTRYAHLKAIDVKVGETITETGKQIGTIGGTPCWNTHLHFGVYRWNAERYAWAVTDPYGWDPWAGPTQEDHLAAQRKDPLIRCNGEVSYNLWVGGYPTAYEQAPSAEAGPPTDGQYIGGWMGDVPALPSPVPPEDAILIDELFTAFDQSGPESWVTSPIGYGGHCFWLPTTGDATRTPNIGSWSLAVEVPGVYEILAFIPAQNATTRHAAYQIHRGATMDQVVVDQLSIVGDWVSLGSYRLDGAREANVQLSALTADGTQGLKVAFDTLALVPDRTGWWEVLLDGLEEWWATRQAELEAGFGAWWEAQRAEIERQIEASIAALAAKLQALVEAQLEALIGQLCGTALLPGAAVLMAWGVHHRRRRAPGRRL